MAKYKLRLSPAGILFLIATLVLIIALVAVIVVLSKSCSSSSSTREQSAETSSLPVSPTDDIEPASTAETESSQEPDDTLEPAATQNISGLEPISTSDAQSTDSISIAPTPVAAATATPSSTDKIYTSPTKAQKNAAKDGYVSKDKVKMRKGPGTNYDAIKTDIAKNTTVTLYEQQGDWWFLKCGSSYGYIRKDMISIGKPSATPASTGSSDSGTYDGTIKTNSVAALRKEASSSSKCIKELKNGDKVTVYYKTKDKSGNYWYYVKYNGQKGYIYSSLVNTSKKVPTK